MQTYVLAALLTAAFALPQAQQQPSPSGTNVPGQSTPAIPAVKGPLSRQAKTPDQTQASEGGKPQKGKPGESQKPEVPPAVTAKPEITGVELVDKPSAEDGVLNFHLSVSGHDFGTDKTDARAQLYDQSGQATGTAAVESVSDRTVGIAVVLPQGTQLQRLGLTLPGKPALSAAVSLTIPRPEITGIEIVDKPSAKDGELKFHLSVRGHDFGNDKTDAKAQLYDQNGQSSGSTTVESVSDQAIGLAVTLPEDTEIQKVALTLHGLGSVSSSRFSVVPVELPDRPEVRPLDIKFKVTPTVYPNIYSLTVTTDQGADIPKEYAIPNRLQLTLTPAGASDIQIRSVDLRKVEAVFFAPEKYQVTDVSLSVFDSADLDRRRLVAVTRPHKEAAPEKNPFRPSIDRAQLVSISRTTGFGVVRVEGSNFGEQWPAHPDPHEFLQVCSKGAKAQRDYAERTGFFQRVLNVFSRSVDDTNQLCPKWQPWFQALRGKIDVAIEPTNPLISVGNVRILSVTDKEVLVYFEFMTQALETNLSQPFRLDRVAVSITKNAARSIQQSAEVSGKPSHRSQIEIRGPETFMETFSTSNSQSASLHSEYAIVDDKKARYVFGPGVAENFYVILVSVTNSGTKKMAVPLSTMAAEVQWLVGDPNDSGVTYEEGTPTIPPLPISSVSTYFDAYNKGHSPKAKFLNYSQAVSTLFTTIVPYGGPSLKDATLVFGSGFLPAVKIADPDLTSQQLQALTALSWQNVETIAGGGGSISRYIFVPRGILFNSSPTPSSIFGSIKNKFAPSSVPKYAKEVHNILGLEVVGYEVSDGEAKSSNAEQRQNLQVPTPGSP